MIGASKRFWGGAKNFTTYLLEYLKGRVYSKGVGGMIILKWVLGKYVLDGIEFMWFNGVRLF